MIHIPKTTKEEKIRFLIWNDIPLSKYVTTPQGQPVEPKDQFEEGILQEVEDYQKKLLEMGAAELDQLYQQKRVEEQLRMSEEREAKRFFHQSSAKADFDHWAKCTYWTIDEAVALSLGKAPEIVTWEKVKREPEYSPFVKQYTRIRDLAMRAVKWQQIFSQTLPGIYLAWARQSGIELPEELVTAVEARDIRIANWKDLYEQLQEKYEELQKEYLSALEQQNQLIEAANKLHDENVRQEEERLESDPLSCSEYWCSFRDMVETALAEYPEWRKTQREKISKEGDLTPWVKDRFKITDREAMVIKKVLSDIHSELK